MKKHVILLFILSSCANLSSVKKSQIVFNDEVSITDAAGKTKEITSGSNIDLSKETLLIESPGKVSVMLIPISKEHQEIKVSLKNLDKQKMNTFVGTSINKQLSQVLYKINDVQQLLMEKKAVKAIEKINQLQAEYKDLEYLNFLKVSAYLVKGERKKAKQLLELALQKYPDNIQGKQLYNSLFKQGGI